MDGNQLKTRIQLEIETSHFATAECPLIHGHSKSIATDLSLSLCSSIRVNRGIIINIIIYFCIHQTLFTDDIKAPRFVDSSALLNGRASLLIKYSNTIG